MRDSWSGKHPLSGSHNWLSFQGNSINNGFTVVKTLCSTKKEIKKKKITARYWVALHQQNLV